MRVSQVELRARRSEPAMQSVSDLDDKKPEVEYKASVAIRHAAVPQFTVRIPKVLWKSIGAPPYVDVLGRATEGLKIVPGRNVKVGVDTRLKKDGTRHSSRVSVTVSVAAHKVGLIRKSRPTVPVQISAEKKCIFLDKVPAEWDLEPRLPAPPPKNVLPDMTPPPTPKPTTLPVTLAVNDYGPNSLGLHFLVPSALLAQIGDPERILIEGTPHQGFFLKPSPIGVKLNYKTGKNLYVTCGLTDRNISKQKRLRVTLDTEVMAGGVIKLGGAPREWIQCEGEFRPKPDAPLPPREFHLSKNPGNGTIQTTPVPNGANGNGHHASAAPQATMPSTTPLPNGNTTQAIEVVKTRFQQALNMTRDLKAELERRTGLKFKVTRDLRFVLDI